MIMYSIQRLQTSISVSVTHSSPFVTCNPSSTTIFIDTCRENQVVYHFSPIVRFKREQSITSVNSKMWDATTLKERQLYNACYVCHLKGAITFLENSEAMSRFTHSRLWD